MKKNFIIIRNGADVAVNVFIRYDEKEKWQEIGKLKKNDTIFYDKLKKTKFYIGCNNTVWMASAPREIDMEQTDYVPVVYTYVGNNACTTAVEYYKYKKVKDKVKLVCKQCGELVDVESDKCMYCNTDMCTKYNSRGKRIGMWIVYNLIVGIIASFVLYMAFGGGTQEFVNGFQEGYQQSYNRYYRTATIK